jgi:DNA-directed RNA polymerase specialized sigma24 family protein
LVTPNDGYADGNTSSSNNITIINATIAQVPGILNVSLLTPPIGTTNVTQNATFMINATVYCSGGLGATCGNVTAYARYNDTTNSGGNQTTSNLLTNPGAETGNTNGWTKTWNATAANQTPNAPIVYPHSGSYLFYGGARVAGDSLTSSLYQIVDVSQYASNIDAGLVSVNASGWIAAQTSIDYSNFTVEYQYSNGTNIAKYESPTVSSATWAYYADIRIVPAGTRQIKYTFNSRINGDSGTQNEGAIDDMGIVLTMPATAETMKAINTTAGTTLLYTTSSQPQSCFLTLGQSCQFNWTVNATGNIGNSYKINVNFTSNNASVMYNVTNNATILISTITSISNPPNITLVSAIPAVNLNEGPVATTVNVNFTAYDADGASNLNDSSAMVNFTRAGEAARANVTCAKINTIGNYANYSCNVLMYWFDGAGTWNVTAFIKDASNAVASNTSATFTVNALTGFVASPNSVAFSSLTPGAANQTATNDPVVLNNTGNQNISIGNIQINSTNLKGESNSLLALFANNFSVGISTGGNAECDATNLSRGLFVGVSSAFLPRGNFTVNDGSTGQEQLYFCLKKAGTELTSQAYSTSSEGSWTIKILAVAFAVGARKGKRRKKNERGNRLIEAITLIKDELKERYSSEQADAIDSIIEELREDARIGREDNIPVTIFSREVGALEVLCKYMKENLGMSYHEIAVRISRNDRTVWTACHKAQEKSKEKISARKTEIFIPASVLGDRKYTILEAVIVHLKGKGMKFNEIAKLVDRDQRNVWTIYSRAVKKQN